MRETSQTTDQASRRVLLCGYYGEHNLGDAALFDMLEGLQRGGRLPPVLLILTVAER